MNENFDLTSLGSNLGTASKTCNIAILLEDCGTVTLREFCLYQSTPARNSSSRTNGTGSNISSNSSPAVSHQRNFVEILHHLKGVVAALEHFAHMQYVHKVSF